MAISSFTTLNGSRIALAVALLSPAPVLAQATPATPAAEAADEVPAAEIVVTGSRLRGEAPVGSTVTTIGTADLASSGRVTIDRAIKELPQVFDLGVSENSRGQSGGSGNIVYGNSINLRGIGPNATLIIIDGHRVTNNSRSVDPSVLPTLGVERVEIVADGASAIYGSDAVAGVVNLIPRRSLNGIEAFARGGISGDGNYHEYSAGVAVGKKFERGQVMVAYEHVEKSSLNGSDRSFFTSNQTAMGGNDYSVTRCNPGTLKVQSTYATGGTTIGTFAIPAGGATSGSQLTAGSNKCDDLQGQDLIPQQKYDSVNGTFTYELTDWLTFFADGFYSNRQFRRNPAYASASLIVPSTNPWFVAPTGVTLPDCPATSGVAAGTKCVTVDYNFAKDAPRNTSFGWGESWQITPGIRVKLPHDWQFEALVSKGKTRDNSLSFGGINNSAVTAALRSTSTATAFDPFGLNRTSAALIPSLFNQISINPTIGHFTGYEARINGKLFDLPGGGVKLAAGYEGQEFNVYLGRATGNPGTPIAFTNPGRRVDSAYAELLIPIFGASNATAGFQKLEIDAAVRYDRYSDVGKTTNPKIGVSWMPVSGLTLRGSYGTSFRAPTLPQIYGNTSQLFVQTYQNPAGGTIIGVARSGGNLNLKPETATTWSVGADWEPLPRLRLSTTYFNVDYKNQVVALLSDLAVLSRLSQYDGTGLILQGQAAADAVAALSGLVVSGTLPTPVTLFVDGRSQNLGRSITRGIDFSANYSIPTDKAGTFGLSVSGTYLTTYKTKQTPTAPYVNQLNQIFQPLRFKMRAALTWDKGPFSAGIRATHINGYLNNAVTVPQPVKSYTPVDLNLSWKTGEDHQLIFGLEVRNMFNVKPPYVNLAPSSNGSGGYDATTTDPIGRLFAASARIKW
ncbi:TonB-dependent receptor [Novosphingobium flavum]|uniref:TonB-dependent receptor n=1 Tax=Novosphingobium flavum TaxID=1778672 RepID=A0A7X1FR31_9SPHN|nr:TonB-dependent receptor [Novosphingobium flavum]MBC2665425.1 TonB-dependent receptor [Novosphingobium flavum]